MTLTLVFVMLDKDCPLPEGSGVQTAQAVTPTLQRQSKVVAVATLALNGPSQVFLWVSLWTALGAHNWGTGMYAMFGWGMILVGITTYLQMKKIRQLRKLSALDAATLGVLIVSLAGNALDFGRIFWVGVPLDMSNLILTLVAFACFGLLVVTRKHNPLLTSLPRATERWLTMAGISSRSVIQVAVAIIALVNGAIPVPFLSLIAIALIGMTFMASFQVQYTLNPSPAIRANLYMWRITMLSIVLMGAAYIAAVV